MKFLKKINKISIIILAVAFILGLGGLAIALAPTPTTVNLGRASNFAVLAGSGITNSTGPTTIIGDVGSSSNPTETGFGTVTITGTNHNAADPNDEATQNAKIDLTSAYNTAMNQATPSVTTLVASTTNSFSDIGTTLAPGIYKSPAEIGITGTLTLDGGGNPNAVFIFQASSSTLTTANGSIVALTNGAQACNVFWQVGTSATIDHTTFSGTIMADQSITDTGGSTIVGRFLARIAHVTLNNTKITVPTCAPSLILKKAVSVGSPDDPSVWTLTATGTLGDSDLYGVTDTIGANSDLQFPNATFKADTYTLAEIPITTTNYSATYSCENVNKGITTTTTSSSIVLVAGDKATCTITNTYTAPITTNLLTLVNTITKDNGGTALITDWTLEADGPTQISGITGADAVTNAVVNDGIYTLSETNGPTGYTASTYSCIKNGGSAIVSNTINLANSDNAICTINNTDNAPTLTLQKVVVGGSDGATDWTLEATGPTGFTGLGPIVNNGTSFDIGTYDLSEIGPTGYDASDWVCVGGTKVDGDTIILALDEDATCTITSTYIIEEVTPPDVPIDEVIPTASEGHSSSGSGITYGCKDEKATNYNFFSSNKTELCIYGTTMQIVAETPIVIEIPVIIPNLPHAGFPPQK